MRLVRFAAWMALVASPLAAQDIALDAVHRAEPGGNGLDPATSIFFDELRAELVALGFTLHPRTVFGAAELQGMEAVFLMEPDFERYTDGEIAAIANFAQGGGGVVILAAGFSPLLWNLNQLAAPYGCVFGGGWNDTPMLATPLVSHPITQGLTSFGIHGGPSLFQIGSPATDLTALGGDQNVLAVAESFRGGHDVVLFSCAQAFFDSDSVLDYDLGTPANRLLLRNIAVNATSGHDDFVVMPYTPGAAGQVNTVRVFEAVPAKRVYFIGGLQSGTTALSCGRTL